MRFQEIAIGVRGEVRSSRARYSENVAPGRQDVLREVACGPAAEGISLESLGPGLRLDWTPDADGTALASFFAGPEDGDVVLTCALLPRGRAETSAIHDGIEAIVLETCRAMGFEPDFDASRLPDGPAVVSLAWPNVRHAGVLPAVARIQSALAAAWFVEIRKPQSGVSPGPATTTE